MEGDSNRSSVQLDQQAWFVNNCAVAGQTLIPITPSLQEFFTYFLLRHHSIRFLWIDAIYINQADQVERSTEVQMMARVYSSCTQTIAWLGPEDDDSRAALPIITANARYSDEHIESVIEWGHQNYETLLDRQKERQFLEMDDFGSKSWSGLYHFLKRSWSFRKWTV